MLSICLLLLLSPSDAHASTGDTLCLKRKTRATISNTPSRDLVTLVSYLPYRARARIASFLFDRWNVMENLCTNQTRYPFKRTHDIFSNPPVTWVTSTGEFYCIPAELEGLQHLPIPQPKKFVKKIKRVVPPSTSFSCNYRKTIRIEGNTNNFWIQGETWNDEAIIGVYRHGTMYAHHFPLPKGSAYYEGVDTVDLPNAIIFHVLTQRDAFSSILSLTHGGDKFPKTSLSCPAEIVALGVKNGQFAALASGEREACDMLFVGTYDLTTRKILFASLEKLPQKLKYEKLYEDYPLIARTSNSIIYAGTDQQDNILFGWRENLENLRYSVYYDLTIPTPQVEGQPGTPAYCPFLKIGFTPKQNQAFLQLQNQSGYYVISREASKLTYRYFTFFPRLSTEDILKFRLWRATDTLDPQSKYTATSYSPLTSDVHTVIVQPTPHYLEHCCTTFKKLSFKEQYLLYWLARATSNPGKKIAGRMSREIQEALQRCGIDYHVAQRFTGH